MILTMQSCYDLLGCLHNIKIALVAPKFCTTDGQQTGVNEDERIHPDIQSPAYGNNGNVTALQ
jgi:hypothetical protein